jgi:hypothetical protein
VNRRSLRAKPCPHESKVLWPTYYLHHPNLPGHELENLSVSYELVVYRSTRGQGNRSGSQRFTTESESAAIFQEMERREEEGQELRIIEQPLEREDTASLRAEIAYFKRTGRLVGCSVRLK